MIADADLALIQEPPRSACLGEGDDDLSRLLVGLDSRDRPKAREGGVDRRGII